MQETIDIHRILVEHWRSLGPINTHGHDAGNNGELDYNEKLEVYLQATGTGAIPDELLRSAPNGLDFNPSPEIRPIPYADKLRHMELEEERDAESNKHDQETRVTLHQMPEVHEDDYDLEDLVNDDFDYDDDDDLEINHD
ncbi:hypothetical protein BdWA1_001545 [Babesia duncani]|uniref:Uncharacterized protein n=1 Tax=Babesia duncani TaxID=323732 RepID=A0AAD9PKZ7_9APIC|nr:hypothetical protein BdWA1_001545 [Babesia duncani]